uniref:Uncharacterized protein n=1 Tax=Anas platyrhynchos platyrhynchos TaxID=8840 RepID=A0A493TJ86_ANAPP
MFPSSKLSENKIVGDITGTIELCYNLCLSHSHRTFGCKYHSKVLGDNIHSLIYVKSCRLLKTFLENTIQDVITHTIELQSNYNVYYSLKDPGLP